MTLTFDLENFFSNAHSHDEYCVQVSLKNIALRKIDVNGRQTDGQMCHLKTQCFLLAEV